MRLTPPPEVEEVPGQFWKDFIRETAPVFRAPTIDQLAGFIAPTFQALIDGARYVDDRLLEIIDEVEPDLLVEDNVVSFPALLSGGRPVGPDRLLQPGRDARTRRSRRPSPGCRAPIAPAGTNSGRRTARPWARCTRISRVLPGAGRAAAPAATSSTRARC